MSFALSTSLKQVCRKRTETISLIEYANENRHLGCFNDIEICAENHCFPANKLILSCFSSFFEKMFKVEMKEKHQHSVEISCINGSAMKNLIDFIYTGSININSENVYDLLSASDYLQISDVKQFCFEFLAEAVDPHNCFVIYGIADCYQNDFLRNQVIQAIADNFDQVANTVEFKQLAYDQFEACIIKQSEKKTPMISLYRAVVGWTEYDKENRLNNFPDVLKLIKLDQLPPEYLESVVQHEDMVVNNIACSKMLMNAFSHHLKESKWKTLGGKTRILSVGGKNTLTKVTEIYSCSKGNVKSYPDLPHGRYRGCSVLLHDNLFYVGGTTTEHNVTSSVWRMNLTEKELKWKAVKPMNNERQAMSATVVNGNLVVVGGIGHNSGECFSLVSNSWQDIPSLPESRYAHALVALQNNLYAIGGFNSTCNEYLSSVACLQIGEEKWKYVTSMQVPRGWLAAVFYYDVIYAIGGRASVGERDRLKSVEKYNPFTNQWTYVSEMNFSRSGCLACVLQDRIYVVGGLNENGEIVKEIESYEPFIDKWSIVGKICDDLQFHSLVVV